MVSTRTGWRVPLFALGLGAVAWACDEGGAADDSGDEVVAFDRARLLRDTAKQVLLPAYAAADAAAADLVTALEAQVATPVGEGAAELHAASQDAWRAFATAWQGVEVLQLGPLGPEGDVVGGENLRDAVHTWPIVRANACRIDQTVVDESYATPDFVTTTLPNAYGLGAAEYLLFNTSLDDACPSQVGLDDSWAALSENEIATRRARYALVVAQDMAIRAARAHERWDVDFADDLASAGDDDSLYPDLDAALDDVMRAMFYVDIVVKDAKLDAAATAFEFPWSGESRAAVLANLRQLRLLWAGVDDGYGFEEALVDAGETALADAMRAALDDAIAAVEASPELESETADVAALNAVVKRFTDELKGPFALALQLRVPVESGGDAD